MGESAQDQFLTADGDLCQFLTADGVVGQFLTAGVALG